MNDNYGHSICADHVLEGDGFRRLLGFQPRSSGTPLSSCCLVHGSSAFVRLPHSAHLPTHVDDSRGDATTSGRICPLALGELAYDTPGSGTELRAKRIDLGRDAGLCLREPICSVAGRETAQIFVFREVHDRWISLFHGQAPIGEAFTFGPGITNGIKNLTVAANQNAETAQRLTYQSTVNFISLNKQSYLRSGAQYALGS